MASFSDLPPEVLLATLHYLPIKTLLTFGLTSKRHHAIQKSALVSLRLGVFHSRLGGMMNMLEATANNSYLHSVQMVLPKTNTKNKESIIYMQNLKTEYVLEKLQHSLQDLELAMWDLQDGTMSLLSGLKTLRHLSIRLDHPYTRHTSIKQSFWQEAPGSTMWNLFAPRSGSASALDRLQSLNLERAGITDYQLRGLLKNNPTMRELRLRKCFNLTKETFKYLASSGLGRQLEIFQFTLVNRSHIDNEILRYIGAMVNLRVGSAGSPRYRYISDSAA